ncbi:substrate-binding domain-containing protein [Kitasatospora sp. NPDC001132]
MKPAAPAHVNAVVIRTHPGAGRRAPRRPPPVDSGFTGRLASFVPRRQPCDRTAACRLGLHRRPGDRPADVGGLVSLVYNLDGVDNLVLDGPTAAKIFDSQITKWNDQAIAALNPGATLPDAEIHAEIQSFHRSDDSGTTYNLTSYFAKTSGGAWSSAPDKA